LFKLSKQKQNSVDKIKEYIREKSSIANKVDDITEISDVKNLSNGITLDLIYEKIIDIKQEMKQVHLKNTLDVRNENELILDGIKYKGIEDIVKDPIFNTLTYLKENKD
jgi:hypothetical protein